MRSLRYTSIRWVLFSGLVVASAFIGILSTPQSAQAALATAPYTVDELDAKLYGGWQQAIDWDRTCWERTQYLRSIGQAPRAAINNATNYKAKEWLSLRDTATENNSSRTAPIEVDYGTRSVPLQLNVMSFICAGLVSPRGAGADYPYSMYRIVRPDTGSNDRPPNPVGGGTNDPASIDVRSRIDGITVTGGSGTVTGLTVGNDWIGRQRRDNTRYWFGDARNLDFVSTLPAGITSDTEVKIRFTLRGYHAFYGRVTSIAPNGMATYSGTTISCTNNTPGVNIANAGLIGRCNTNEIELSVRITIRSVYDLTPEVDVYGQTSIEPGGEALAKNTVTKSAGSTDTKETDWRLTQLVYAPGAPLGSGDKTAREGGGDPCGAFSGAGRTECTTAQRDDRKIFRDATTTFAPQYAYTAPDSLSTGSQVCFVASVSKPTQTDTPVWRHSSMKCMIVGKKPKVQVHGGDVRVGGKIETSTSAIKVASVKKTFGSWVEYGSLSVGPNTNFASGSALNKGSTASANTWHRLTFANIDNTGSNSYGFFTMPTGSLRLANQFMGANSDGAPGSNLGSLSSGTYKTSGNLTINTSTVGQQSGKGKSIIVVAAGTVTINGDITYEGAGASDTFTSIKELPQVVIIANRINIAGSVRTINAWLLTTGSAGAINTCSDVAVTAPLNSTVCANKLTVNGPIATNHLYLRRTAGANNAASANEPAEVFNLRADAYLWSRERSTSAGKAQTLFTRELPPRF